MNHKFKTDLFIRMARLHFTMIADIRSQDFKIYKQIQSEILTEADGKAASITWMNVPFICSQPVTRKRHFDFVIADNVILVFLHPTRLELPTAITTVEEANNFIAHLESVGKAYHFDDDPAEIIDLKTNEPIFCPEDAEHVNKLMEQICDICELWDLPAIRTMLDNIHAEYDKAMLPQ